MSDIFDIWPTMADMARDLGVPYPTVAAWSQRGIPAARDGDVIAAARARGVTLTFEQMHERRQALRAQRVGAK